MSATETTNNMKFSQLSLETIIRNISNAFIGTLQELNTHSIITVLEKDRRYMYLSLLILVILIIIDVIDELNL